MLFDDILHGAEGRFAAGWRRLGARLEANHGELDRIATKQKRDAEELRKRERECREAFDRRYEEQEASIAEGERSFDAHMLDVDKALSAIRAERRTNLPGEVPVDNRNRRKEQEGTEHVGK